MATRTRKQVKQYQRQLKNIKNTDESCVFCHVVEGDERVMLETKSFYVIKNIYGYVLWDSQKVA